MPKGYGILREAWILPDPTPTAQAPFRKLISFVSVLFWFLFAKIRIGIFCISFYLSHRS